METEFLFLVTVTLTLITDTWVAIPIPSQSKWVPGFFFNYFLQTHLSPKSEQASSSNKEKPPVKITCAVKSVMIHIFISTKVFYWEEEKYVICTSSFTIYIKMENFNKCRTFFALVVYLSWKYFTKCFGIVLFII